MKVKTLKQSSSIKGIGIHSGLSNTIQFTPSNKGYIEFIHRNKSLKVCPNNLAKTNNRATTLENEFFKIITPEHLLSACAGLGINSLMINVENEEIPILDGSAKDYVDLFISTGSIQLDISTKTLLIKEPIIIENKVSKIIILPSPHTRYSYYLHYPNHFIQSQFYSIELKPENYINEIAAARTYGFEHEIQALLNQGLAKGGSLNNALIIGENDYINKSRFEDECVRHKVLDLIGDFSILGPLIKGHIIAIKSGHQLNSEAVQVLDKLKT